jgi:hypothetical protein
VPSGVAAIAPTSANSPGAGPIVQCGGPGGATLGPYLQQAVGPTRQLSFPVPDLVQHGGNCSISFSLADGASPDPYGGPSPVITAAFTIGTQPTYTFAAAFTNCGDFQCGPLGRQYTIEFTALGQFQGGGNWTFSAGQQGLPAATDPCYVSVQSSSTPPAYPVELTVPQDCDHLDKIAVAVSWEYLGQQGASETWAGTPGNNAPPPATTTTTSTSTTTTTTLPPCPPSGTTTTSDCQPSTTTTSAGPAAAGRSRSPGTALAAAYASPRTMASPAAPPADRGARWAVGLILAATLAAGIVSPLLMVRNRKSPEKRSR